MQTTIDLLLSEKPFHKESFFVSLRQGNMNFEQFLATQYQFSYAVTHFVVPIALVAAAIPTYKERIKIVKNLWEEHGEGDLGNTHGRTFTLFLQRLKKTDIIIPESTSAVTRFNQRLEECCRNQSYLVSVAAIGMIERMFSEISSYIGSSVVERGWMKPEEMIHYSVHEELDVIHAQDFFEIIEPHYKNENGKKLIDHGLLFGRNVFLEFYQDLYREVQ